VFRDPELAEKLAAAEPRNGRLHVPFTLYDIEDLCGSIAAEMNHTKDQKLPKELQALFEWLSDVMDRYDDGNWQG
jgi:hypothetical protein